MLLPNLPKVFFTHCSGFFLAKVKLLAEVYCASLNIF